MELWCMCCNWWKPTRRRKTHLYITRWIYRRDTRCDRIHGIRDSSKESYDSSQYDKLAFPSSSKGEIVNIMMQVLSLMEGWQIIVHQVSSKELMIRLQRMKKDEYICRFTIYQVTYIGRLYTGSLCTKLRIYTGSLNTK